MEHPCHNCGQAVEQGIAFCAHCGAPQIRVVMPEQPSLPPTSEVASFTEVPAMGAGSLNLPGVTAPVRWSRSLPPCGLAALAAFLLMILGLNPFVAIVFSGALSVVFYRRRNGGPISGGRAAQLGALSGLLWFSTSSLVEGVMVTLFHKGPEFRKALLERIQQAASQTNDPKVLAMFDHLRTPEGLAVGIVVSIVLAFFFTLFLGAIGGALSGRFLRWRGSR